MTALFAIWVLITGLDDLFLDLASLYRWLLSPCVLPPSEADLAATPHRRIAVFVPLWREHGVMWDMIEHNVLAHAQDWCDFFIGVYPNDERTLAVARELEEGFENVHVSVCPHDGPTSKADNLNWIFESMTLFEAERRTRFDIVITHDAEDLIHPDALRWVNYYISRYDMVQIPVLPIPTPPLELLHGVYCDEFADYQGKELPARQFLGGFLPSCGVGAGFSRFALDRLAAAYRGNVFEPRCLTEDYESGFRLHQLGCAQIFVPITRRAGDIVATRGYFPRTFRAAVKQRTRWVMGIGLQSWELHGWRDTLSQLYWFWRDRKGIVGALAGPVANVVFLYGAGCWYANGMAGHLSGLFVNSSSAWIADVFAFSITLQAVHLGVRMRLSARVYGWKFASAAPLRVGLGVAINFVATLSAMDRYFRAKWTGQPLAWLKTEHYYPSVAVLAERRRVAEVLAPPRSKAARAGL